MRQIHLGIMSPDLTAALVTVAVMLVAVVTLIGTARR